MRACIVFIRISRSYPSLPFTSPCPSPSIIANHEARSILSILHRSLRYPRSSPFQLGCGLCHQWDVQDQARAGGESAHQGSLSRR